MNRVRNILKSWEAFIRGTTPERRTQSEKEAHSPNDFSKLDADSRITAIISLGDTGLLQHFALIKYAILNDPNKHVKFAALKRLHRFKEHPHFEALLEQVKNINTNNQLEPYFSMALLKLGVISQAEFESKINSH